MLVSLPVMLPNLPVMLPNYTGADPRPHPCTNDNHGYKLSGAAACQTMAPFSLRSREPSAGA